MRIRSRAEWSFDGWRGTPYGVGPLERTHMMVHYEGGPTGGASGPNVPLSIHHFHRDGRKWKGIGYNYVIDNAGNVWEGRGFELDGAHCTNWNRKAFGVQIHIGGNETPSAAALVALDELYAYLCFRVGRTLAVNRHRDGMSTDCPGPYLTQYVPTHNWGDQLTGDIVQDSDIARIARTVVGMPIGPARDANGNIIAGAESGVPLSQWIIDTRVLAGDAQRISAQALAKIDALATAVAALAAKLDTD